MYLKLWLLWLPYTRLELPGWGKLKFIRSFDDNRWSNAPTKLTKGKLHGYWMKLDLSDWSQRMTYFLGRYYELGVQQLLNVLLVPGDRFIDIGANIGMITLHAAHLVTEKGQVDCFEPNPECVEAIKGNLKLNNIKHVTVYPVGLSDSSGTLQLNLSSSHTGTATLVKIDNAIETFDVQIVVGDEIISPDSCRIKLIKIDVEGFELHVLKGLKKTLDNSKPLLITEFVESHFQRAGTSSKEIETFLKGIGYMPYGIATQRKWMRHSLKLIALDNLSNTPEIEDIFWMHSENSVDIGKYL